MTISPLNFGILGTGNIAAQFVEAVARAAHSRAVAVASRRKETASTFARRFDIPEAHAGYDALLENPRVEAVYNALPNTMHHDWTIRALEAGKHVLCEKPLAVSAAEARRMFDAARRCRRLLVEGFMYRCHPLTEAWMEEIRRGTIGRLTLVRTSFCYATTRVNDNIRFRPDLAGGALMDVGCYCISLARMVAGSEPVTLHAVSTRQASNVDLITSGTLTFDDGLLASFTCGMNAQTDNSALLCGTEGYIQVPIPWKPPTTDAPFIVRRMTPPKMDRTKAPAGPDDRKHSVTADRPLFALEADAFAAAARDGAEPFVSEQDSMGNMRALDEMRRMIGTA